MIPTNLISGTKNSNGDKFEIDEKEHLVKRCPSGHKPIQNILDNPEAIMVDVVGYNSY